jgi:ABC-type transporter Mla subunit MlaD
MADRTAKLRLGGFVAASLAALAALVLLFGGAPRVFSQRAKYVVLFAEAPGIAPGTPVRKSGVRIGEVTALDLDEATGQVRVTLEVDKRYLPRTNEEATVFRGILSGDTSVDLVPKANPDGTPVADRGEPLTVGTTIAGITPVNPSQLVRQASGVLPTAQESMARILSSVERVERAVPKIEKAFEEVGGLARSGREFVPELRRTNDKLQEVLAFADQPDPDKPQPGLRTTLNEINEFLRTARPLVEDLRRLVRTNEADLTGTIKSVRSASDAVNDLLNPANRKALADALTNLSVASGDLGRVLQLIVALIPEFDRTAKQLNARLAQAEPVLRSADEAFRSAAAAARNLEAATKPLGERFGPTVENINIAADQLAKTLTELRETLRAVNRGDGTLQKALADPSLYNNLNDAAVSLTRTLMRAERAAADLQVFADKIARRPEVIGVGGAVRPSAGLKESPSAPISGPPIPPSPLPPSPGLVPSYRAPTPGDLPPK